MIHRHARSCSPPRKSSSGSGSDSFALIEELVEWKNITNETVLESAREEIRRSWRRTCEDNLDHPRAAELFDPDRLPAFHDPFAGGGAIPLGGPAIWVWKPTPATSTRWRYSSTRP